MQPKTFIRPLTTLAFVFAGCLLSTAALATKPRSIDAPPPPILLDDHLPASALPATPPVTIQATRGQLLYENHCQGCHESVVHIRERRLAKSLPDLRAQVARWAAYQNLHWAPEEIEEVVRHLNARHYRLD